jgi:pimeloyl-ACP methyl ester carboxylesterase
MPHAIAGDLRMYYEEHRQADGPPLVLLHGFTATGTSWRPYLETFGTHYRLLVPDLRGHGHTPNPGGLAAMNHRQFARDIIALCHALGVGRAAFCGASTGAMLLLTLGLEAPDLPAALVLAGGTYFYGEELRAWFATQTPDTLTQTIFNVDDLRARHAPGDSDGWRDVLAAWIALGTHAHSDDFPQQEELSSITAPTLVIHGDRDRFFPVAVPITLYGLLPDAELCILPRTGHTPVGERPEWFTPIALDFLQRRAIYERPAE